MEEKFPEIVFIHALLSREEDCKKFSSLYHEDWFQRAECGVVFQEIRAFLKKHMIPPSVKVRRTILKQKDSLAYENRFKEVLDQIEDYGEAPDQAEVKPGLLTKRKTWLQLELSNS